MEKKIQKILEFVDRSLIISQEVKVEIISNVNNLSSEKIDKLGTILFKVDNQQTKILSEKLEKEPWFFMKLQGIVSRSSYQEHLKEELGELNELESKFDTMLGDL